jgi:hypothetical protein
MDAAIAVDILPFYYIIKNVRSGNSSVVELYLAKVDVAGSNPVSRSNFFVLLCVGEVCEANDHGESISIRKAPNCLGAFLIIAARPLNS